MTARSHRPWRYAAPALAVIAAAMPAGALAQSGERSAQGVASAEIVEPLTVKPVNSLRFGAIAVAAAQAGSVTVRADNSAVLYAGGAAAACSGGAGCDMGAAVFAIKGDPGRNFLVILPAALSASPSEPKGLMLPVSAISAWSRNLAATGTAGRLDGSGKDEISVGGTLEIPAGTLPGDYTAEVAIVVNYG